MAKAVQVTYTVSQSSDDCFKYYSSGWGFTLTATYFSAGSVNPSFYAYSSGARFQSVMVPQGSNITAAKLIFNCRISESGTVVRTNIYGEDIDDASTFTTLADFNGRTRTGNYTVWDNIPAWTANTEYDSPEIKDIIQEIVDRGGWSSGNDMVMFWEDDGSDNASARRTGKAYDYAGGSNPPQLQIDYEIEKYYVTFYNNTGGIFVVNNDTISNGTTNEYVVNTTIELVGAVDNSSYVFLNFNWTSGYNETNTYDYTIISNATIWCNFDEPKTKITTGLILAGLFITIAVCGIIIFRKKRLSS